MSENTDQPIEEQEVHAEVVLDESETHPTAEDLGLDLPPDPEEAVDFLLLKLKEARDEAGSYLDDLRRVAADFDNYRRRAIREQQETTQRAAEKVVNDLLPALDSFDAAVSVEASTDAEEKLLAGMHRTHEQILTILRGLGLEVVPTVGEWFDPEMHEAVMSPSEGSGRLVVTQELRRGYRLKDRLVRPALVAVDYASEEDQQ
ncbi:MAG: nucleotide exchange factor GrpE [Actinomycetota bacterium]